jgi:hypothetical protein
MRVNYAMRLKEPEKEVTLIHCVAIYHVTNAGAGTQ